MRKLYVLCHIIEKVVNEGVSENVVNFLVPESYLLANWISKLETISMIIDGFGFNVMNVQVKALHSKVHQKIVSEIQSK